MNLAPAHMRCAPWRSRLIHSLSSLLAGAVWLQIYVFYRLGSFFQNYRRYVRSIDSNAMHDGSSGAGSSACDPFRYVGDEANPALPNNGAIFPCGQIANSNFNDSFTMTLTPEGGSEVPLEMDVSGFEELLLGQAW